MLVFRHFYYLCLVRTSHALLVNAKLGWVGGWFCDCSHEVCTFLKVEQSIHLRKTPLSAVWKISKLAFMAMALQSYVRRDRRAGETDLGKLISRPRPRPAMPYRFRGLMRPQPADHRADEGGPIRSHTASASAQLLPFLSPFSHFLKACASLSNNSVD